MLCERGAGGICHDSVVAVVFVVISHLDPQLEICDGLNSVPTGPN